MTSAMAENFRLRGWLCRAAGVFFIKNLQSADVDEMEVTWKSWYTLYSLACLSISAAINLEFVATKMMELSPEARAFTKALFLVVPLAVSSKVLTNIFSVIFGSRYRYRSRISYVLRFLMVVAFSGNIVVTAHMTVSTAGFGSNYSLDLLRVVTILGNFFLFFYDMLHSMTLRPCCEVLVAYIRHQHAIVRAVLPTDDRGIVGPLGTTGVRELQRVKANLRSIGKLRQLLNDIWQFSLAVSSVAVLIVGCITVYCTFDSGMPLNQILLSLSYFVYSALDFVDVARLSHAMVAEVAHLYISIRPEDMSLSGGSFVAVDLPLLVSCHIVYTISEPARTLVQRWHATSTPPKVVDMASAMAENFRVHGWLCRAAGVFFVKNLHGADVDEMEVTWKSWYTLYSVALLCVFGAINLEFVATKMMELSTRARSFTKALFLVVPLAVSSKVVTNIVSAIVGSVKMKQFFKNAFEHEMETSFWRQRYRYRSRISYALRFFMAVAFSANIVVTAHMTMSTAGFGNNYYLDLLRVSTILGNFFFFFYDMLHSITLRPCCEVLIAYIQHQHAIVRAVLPTDDRAIVGPLGTTGVAELQRVKTNLRSIGKLRQLLNDIWQFSLAVSSAAVLIVGCITVYCTFDSGVPLNQILLSLSYFVYSALDFVDVARLSHEMAGEVAHLYASICPEDMSLSGGNFFAVDLPLLVSIGGSIITYSVILVQTSDNVEHHQVPHMNSSEASEQLVPLEQ
ncbi:hypothetical protein HPB50_002199 [Hyalomma asiaticum]|uniref:Uncharacterized protein n=1 Tax=Hyalomma asiaticum TaxID=266040 RepID=A0ACB7RM40_HYAAI|nr:hypothetical protein HPB50_002199 [Hyalomma asiaticum]